MTDRWRVRRLAGLAMVAVLSGFTASAIVIASEDGPPSLVVRDASGAERARVSLAPPAGFALRYRNSVYRSLAEEHFQVEGDQLRLVELRADELAVLEEYYTAVGAQRMGPRGSRAWRIRVERPMIDLPLHVQATELGRRTLLVGEQEIGLWRLMAGSDDTSITLSVEDQ